jgi:23S rRNA maturation mini-RNase III
MDLENEAIKSAKNVNEMYSPITLNNGDAVKELLARSRYILAKKESQRKQNQKERTHSFLKDTQS